jgi:hypothetical protein
MGLLRKKSVKNGNKNQSKIENNGRKTRKEIL